MVILETKRLILRHLELGDLDALYRLYRDPQIRAHFPDGTRTLSETKEELEWFLHGHPGRPELGLWATVERSTGAFLGRCGLLPWTIDGQSEVELAYLIDKSRWGEGLATEAARGIIQHARTELHLTRLICLHHAWQRGVGRRRHKGGHGIGARAHSRISPVPHLLQSTGQ